ncbi:hypothetical protein BS78_05G081200 [Paspalum vaginatum]|nr:hypothetical protein BS78_05G081200 [Paspalum vaginatum]
MPIRRLILCNVCELFAEQVEKGTDRFFQMTGIELSRIQLKNKWDKLKPEFVARQKLMRRLTGTGWDHLKKTIDMDPGWWRKMKAEIPGCSRFKKGPLQNEAELTVMFRNITNDENDHWNPMTEDPIIPESQVAINLEDDFVAVEHDIVDDSATTLPDGDVADDVSPSVASVKKRARVVLGKQVRRTKSSTAVVMQEHVKRLADSADAIATKRLGEVIIKQVMEMVVACGASVGSNEHFVATKLFVKREQREMFLTLDTDERRLSWLRRMYDGQYGA